MLDAYFTISNIKNTHFIRSMFCPKYYTFCVTLYYIILYYTILCYSILCYTMLYYTILYYTILYYTILYYVMLCYAMLYYTILCYAMLCYAMLYYAILYYIFRLLTNLHLKTKKSRKAGNPQKSTISYKIFETNSNFRVK